MKYAQQLPSVKTVNGNYRTSARGLHPIPSLCESMHQCFPHVLILLFFRKQTQLLAQLGDY